MRTEYSELLRTLRRISKELLPARSPTASYSDGEILRMFAYRLSAHAEIEGYLEFCAESLVTHYASRNRAGKLSSHMQRMLLIHNEMRESFPPKSLSIRPDPRRTVAQRINGCLNAQLNAISMNNGVSEKDILKLFVPLGFDFNYFDLDWLNAMNDLAAARGQAAHNSWLGGGSTQPSPDDERQRLVVPLLGIRRLIDEATRLQAIA